MKRLIISLLLLSMASVASASNHYSTCSWLQQTWQEYNKELRGVPFNAYRSAFFQAYVIGWSESDTAINFPTEFTFDQGHHIVGNWLGKHPALWHKNRTDCVYRALKEAYGLK